MTRPLRHVGLRHHHKAGYSGRCHSGCPAFEANNCRIEDIKTRLQKLKNMIDEDWTKDNGLYEDFVWTVNALCLYRNNENASHIKEDYMQGIPECCIVTTCKVHKPKVVLNGDILEKRNRS